MDHDGLNDETVDFLNELYVRNMINIIGKILDGLSSVCLINLLQVNSFYRTLVYQDPRSMNRLRLSHQWINGQPDIIPVSHQEGHMITTLAVKHDSIIYGCLGHDATVRIHSKDSLKLKSTLVQSRDFPASVSAVDYNDDIVATCSYESLDGASLTHAVYLWKRKEKTLAAKLAPHTELIRSIKLTNRYLLTCGNDGTVVVTDIQNSDKPRIIHRITEHEDFVSGIDCDLYHFVSASVDKVLKVWQFSTMQCVHTLKSDQHILKVAMSWPLAATGALNIVLLWNIDKGFLIRQLATGNENGLSCIAMSWLPSTRTLPGNNSDSKNSMYDNIYLVSGDNRGLVSIWDTSVIEAGHPCKLPHRYIQIGSENNLVSSIAVDRTSIFTADWSGNVFKLQFGR